MLAAILRSTIVVIVIVPTCFPAGAQIEFTGQIEASALPQLEATSLAHLTSTAAGSEEAELIPAGATLGDRVGTSVSLSGDTAVIGSPATEGETGAAYVFVRVNGAWTQQAKLTASDGETGDNFGGSVSLSGDRVLIGAIGDDDVGTEGGAAYVFVRTDDSWTQEAKLTTTSGASPDILQLGSAVSLSGDTALVGARGADDGRGFGVGAAYVFVRSDGEWVEEAKLAASDGEVRDYFGEVVSLSADTALIGAVENADQKGAAYVFVKTGGTWTQQAKLIASDGSSAPGDGRPGDQFGSSVSVSGDIALVGAVGDDQGRGAVYVYTRTNETWAEQAKLIAADRQISDFFGNAASLDGETAIIGSLSDDDGGASSGAAYVFTLRNAIWLQEAKLTASDAASRDFFGTAVSINSGKVLIGAPSDVLGKGSGSAYVFGDINPVSADNIKKGTVSVSLPAPNPARGRTEVSVTLPRPGQLHATVYDALGRPVAYLHDGAAHGSIRLSIDTGGLASGLYVVLVVGEGFAESRRLVVVH